jgi:hypothetical protein
VHEQGQQIREQGLGRGQQQGCGQEQGQGRG